MSASGRFDHLRHAALDMLDAGNSPAAVANVLAVPVDVLVRWRHEPAAPPLEPSAQLAALVAQGHAPRFDTTLVVMRSAPRHLWRDTLWLYLRPVLLLGSLWLLWDLWTQSPGRAGFYVDVLPLAGGVAIWALRNRPLLLLNDRAIVVPHLIGNTVMPYADLKDWWLVMHVLHEGTDDEVEGRLLTLHSRGGRGRPVEVFVADHVEIDPLVLERLELVKKVNQGVGPLTRVASGVAG